MSPKSETPDTADTPEAPEPEQVIGLKGGPIKQPTGKWFAEVGQDGRPVRQDGLLVKVPD